MHYIYKIHFWLELDLSEIVSLNLRRCLISKCNPLEGIKQPGDKCVNLTATLLSWKQG